MVYTDPYGNTASPYEDDYSITDDSSDYDTVLDPTQTGDYGSIDIEGESNPFPLLAIGSGSTGWDTDIARELAGSDSQQNQTLPDPDSIPGSGGASALVIAVVIIGVAWVLGQLVGD